MEEKLKQIAEMLPQIESVAIVDEEGFIISSYEKSGVKLDTEEIAVHLVNPLNRLLEMVEDLSGESDTLEEMVLFTRNHIFLVYKLVNDTYLVIVAKKDPLYGKVRFKVRSKLPEIKSSL